MDVGCYCVSAIRLLAGEPVRARGAQLAGGGGVDLAFAGVLELPDGVLGLFDCALSLPSRTGLEVVGEEGTITVADPWFARAGGLEVRRGEAVEAVVPERANAYRLELENLAAAAAGTAAPLLGRADAVGQARALEALHASA
jgi:hypothetical protein